MDKGEGLLSQRTIDRLYAVAGRRGRTGWSVDAIVYELAGDALAAYLLVDVSLGGTAMDTKDKAEPEISDAEFMRRCLESCPTNAARDGLTDEELLEVTGRELREYETRRLQRGKNEANPTASPRGRG